MEKEYFIQAKKHLRQSAVTFSFFVLATAFVMLLDIRGVTLITLSLAVFRRRAGFDEFKKSFESDRKIYTELTVLEWQYYANAARNTFVIMSAFFVFSILWNACGGEIKGVVCFVYFAMVICFFFFWRNYRKKAITAQESDELREDTTD